MNPISGNFLVSVVIPCKNEEEIIQHTYNELTGRLKKFNYEIVFIDDGSSDQTLLLLKNFAASDSHVKIVPFIKNFGQQAAFRAGLDTATGNCIVLLEADLQTPASLIEPMIQLWKGGQPAVFSTYSRKTDSEYFKRITANIFYKVYNFFTSNTIPQNMSNLLLVDAKYINKCNKYMLVKANLFCSAGGGQMLHFEVPARKYGKTKFGLIAMLRLALLNIIVAIQIPWLAKYIVNSSHYYKIRE